MEQIPSDACLLLSWSLPKEAAEAEAEAQQEVEVAVEVVEEVAVEVAVAVAVERHDPGRT